MKRIFTCVALLFFAIQLNAQISTNTLPYSFNHPEDFAPIINPVKLPNVDVDKLLAEDALVDKAFDNRFAFPHEVNYSLTNSGTWTELANGDKVWRLKYKSQGAYSLNVVFDHFELPEGATVHIYSPSYDYVIGGFTSRNNKENFVLATMPIEGDEAIIEYFEPKNVAGEGILKLQRICHDYKNIFDITVEKGFNTSGSCNNNVACPEADDWQDQVNSIAMSMISGTRWCSGAMVANTRNDSVPYYLTADHCIVGQNPATWLFVFNYKSPTCDPSTNAPTNNSVANSTLRANRSNTDFALLELSSIPPFNYNVYYSGWDKTDTDPTSQVGIHHPDGDVMKISFDNDPATKQTAYGITAWEIDDWDDGTTEGGSSGSPLYNQNKLIIGQLYGGTASCGNPTAEDYYGRFDISWNGTSADKRLKDWLDPDNLNPNTLNGYYLNAVTGVEDEIEQLDFSVYPNPSAGQFFVKSDKQVESIQVFSLNGQEVFASKNSNKFDLSHLENGIYILRLNQSQVLKIEILK